MKGDYMNYYEEIKNNEYEGLDTKIKEKLVTKEQILPQDFIENQIFINNSYEY